MSGAPSQDVGADHATGLGREQPAPTLLRDGVIADASFDQGLKPPRDARPHDEG